MLEPRARAGVALVLLASACGGAGNPLPLVDAGAACEPSPDRGPPRFARTLGGGGDDYLFQLVAAANGGFLLTASYEGTPDFGLGPLPAPSGRGVALLKLDANGRPSWGRTFGDDPRAAVEIASVPDGGVAIASYFSGTIDFGGGPLTAMGGSDIAVARLDASGDHVWSRRYGGSGDERPVHVSVAADGGIVLSGGFQGTVDFGTGPLVSTSEGDMFVARFDGDGTPRWARSYGPSESGVWALVMPTGGLLASGEFTGSPDMGAGTIASAGKEDVFVTMLDDLGNAVWTKRFGGAGQDFLAPSVDSAGRIFLAGWFTGTADFGGPELTSAGDEDLAVVRLDNDGATVWAKRFGGWGSDIYIRAAPDDAGGVALAGTLEETLDLGGGSLAGDFADIYAARLDERGDHLWSQRFGCDGAQMASSVLFGRAGEVVIAGIYENSVDFGTGALTSAGRADIFFAALPP